MILGIETSTTACSIALCEQGQLVASLFTYAERSHSESLLEMINQLLAMAKTSLPQLSAIAISEGPGSYTGLRIGATAAKALCYALEKPLVAVNTLEAMAFQCSQVLGANDLLMPVIDARREEVFTALFDSSLARVSELDALVLDEETFAPLMDAGKRIIVLGNASEKCQKIMRNREELVFLHGYNPKAEQIALLGEKRFLQKQWEDVAYFEPHYLKEFFFKESKNKLA